MTVYLRAHQSGYRLFVTPTGYLSVRASVPDIIVQAENLLGRCCFDYFLLLHLYGDLFPHYHLRPHLLDPFDDRLPASLPTPPTVHGDGRARADRHISGSAKV